MRYAVSGNIAASRRLFASADDTVCRIFLSVPCTFPPEQEAPAYLCLKPYFEACYMVRSSFAVFKQPDFFRAERALLNFLSSVHSVHLNSQ
jgi:hypothetical protein